MHEVVPLPALEAVVNLLIQAMDLHERETALPGLARHSQPEVGRNGHDWQWCQSMQINRSP